MTLSPPNPRRWMVDALKGGWICTFRHYMYSSPEHRCAKYEKMKKDNLAAHSLLYLKCCGLGISNILYGQALAGGR